MLEMLLECDFDVLRFLHPGVLDKGNYSMFAAPRPILPGEPEDSKPVPKEKQVISQNQFFLEMLCTKTTSKY